MMIGMKGSWAARKKAGNRYLTFEYAGLGMWIQVRVYDDLARMRKAVAGRRRTLEGRGVVFPRDRAGAALAEVLLWIGKAPEEWRLKHGVLQAQVFLVDEKRAAENIESVGHEMLHIAQWITEHGVQRKLCGAAQWKREESVAQMTGALTAIVMQWIMYGAIPRYQPGIFDANAWNLDRMQRRNEAAEARSQKREGSRA